MKTLEQLFREHMTAMDQLSTQQTNWVSGLVSAISEGRPYDIPDITNRPDAGDAEAPPAKGEAQQLDGALGWPDTQTNNGRTAQDISGTAAVGEEAVGLAGAGSSG